MIIIIQAIVIILAGLIIFVMLGQRSTHSVRAWKKIALLLLAIAMIVAVLFPRIVDGAASLMGVGRGPDLLLYVTVVAFIAYALNNYLHQQDQRDVLYRLARKVAILEAEDRYDVRVGRKKTKLK